MLIGLETSNVATILGSNVLLKPRGIPCTRLPRSRTSQRETNGAKCAIAFLEQLIVLCTDSSAALGFVKKGASRRTRHVDTKVHFMQAWAMEPGQRILKVHGDNSQQVADCLTKSYNSSVCFFFFLFFRVFLLPLF